MPLSAITQTVGATIALGLVIAQTGCAGQEIASRETMLAAAGFQIQAANTPERLATLRSLPPEQLVAFAHAGHQRWIYADPYECKCLYVGGPQQYQRYAQERVQARIAETQLQAAQINEMNWNAFGPWPWGPWAY